MAFTETTYLRQVVILFRSDGAVQRREASQIYLLCEGNVIRKSNFLDTTFPGWAEFAAMLNSEDRAALIEALEAVEE
jgi:hypothetical protein